MLFKRIHKAVFETIKYCAIASIEISGFLEHLLLDNLRDEFLRMSEFMIE